MIRALQAVAELRHAFDASFARPLATGQEEHEELLLLRVNQTFPCLRIAQVALISRCPPLTPLPCRQAALAGLAGVRGNVVAAYRLASLIGEAPSKTEGLMLTAAEDRTAAFLYDELVGYARVPVSSIHTSRDSARRASELVTIGERTHSIISMPTLLESIRTNAGLEQERTVPGEKE